MEKTNVLDKHYAGDLDKKKSAHPSVIGLFKRDSMVIQLPNECTNPSVSPSFVVTVTIPEENAHPASDETDGHP